MIRKISQDTNLTENILNTTKQVSNLLTRNNIKHSIIGGIAIGGHTTARTTKDIDIMISDTDVEKVKSLFGNTEPLNMVIREGFTTVVNGIDVDFVITDSHEEFLHSKPIPMPKAPDHFSIANLYHMLYLKLTSGSRTKDIADAVELLKYIPNPRDFLLYVKKELKKSGLDEYRFEEIYEEIKNDVSSLAEIAKIEKLKKKANIIGFMVDKYKDKINK